MKKIKLLASALLLAVTLTAQAQEMVLNDPTTARMFNTEKYSEVKGTPFFIDKWMEGSVSIDKGTYPRLLIKYDVHENQLLFSSHDMSYQFADPVYSFVLKPNPADSSSFMYFIKGISGNSLKEDQFVQVLAKGRLSLYRSDIKQVSDLNEINKGTIKNFSTVTRYYAKKEGAVSTLIKLNKQEVLDLVKDKEAAIQQFIDANKISLKKEGDVAKLIRHYNTLP